MKSKSKQAFISWCLDASSSIVVLVLLAAWLSDLQSAEPSFLSKSFVENGFCLSPRFNNTHTFCAVFDVICGVCFLAVMLVGKASRSTVGTAVYFIAHGFGHYDVGQSDLTQERGMNLQDSIILSIIISVGPLSMARKMVDAKKMTRSVANAVAAVLLASLVGLYFFYIKRPTYALLYINLSIFLSGYVPSCLMIGFKSKEDIAYRSSDFYWPQEIARFMVAAVIFCEPFFCDSFVASIGGHFVFDASLAFQALASLMKQQAEQNCKEEKLKTK